VAVMDAWMVWAILAVSLGVLEIFTLDLTLLMLAGGAATGAATGWAGAPWWVQMLVAAGTSVALLGVVRPLAMKHRRTPAALRTGSAALVGMNAECLEAISDTAGLVKLNGEVWTARSYDASQIDAGTTVQVIEIDGAIAKVLPL
jgi:membrane protein implicated in regulation of membrane protease activity